MSSGVLMVIFFMPEVFSTHLRGENRVREAVDRGQVVHRLANLSASLPRLTAWADNDDPLSAK